MALILTENLKMQRGKMAFLTAGRESTVRARKETGF